MAKYLIKKVNAMLMILFFVIFFSQVSYATPTDAISEFKAGDRPKSDFPSEVVNKLEYLDSDIIEPASLDHIYVTHIPSISFGEIQISKEDQEYLAFMEKRRQSVSNKSYYLPHMIGVADLNGKKNGKWKVTVNQEKPFQAVDGGEYLYYSRIRLYGNTVTNSGVPSSRLGQDLTGVKKMQEHNYSQIPVMHPMLDKFPSEGELDVLNSNTPGFTNKTYSNSVMKSNYQRSEYQANQGTQAPKTEDVKLFISSKDSRLAKKYEADLVWTLTAEP